MWPHGFCPDAHTSLSEWLLLPHARSPSPGDVGGAEHAATLAAAARQLLGMLCKAGPELLLPHLPHAAAFLTHAAEAGAPAPDAPVAAKAAPRTKGGKGASKAAAASGQLPTAGAPVAADRAALLHGPPTQCAAKVLAAAAQVWRSLSRSCSSR
jgi:hypothetical protein